MARLAPSSFQGWQVQLAVARQWQEIDVVCCACYRLSRRRSVPLSLSWPGLQLLRGPQPPMRPPAPLRRLSRQQALPGRALRELQRRVPAPKLLLWPQQIGLHSQVDVRGAELCRHGDLHSQCIEAGRLPLSLQMTKSCRPLSYMPVHVMHEAAKQGQSLPSSSGSGPTCLLAMNAWQNPQSARTCSRGRVCSPNLVHLRLQARQPSRQRRVL